MLQSVLRKMCVFMWILTLSLNYIRSRNVDEAKFFFFYGVCLKNTFQLERRAAAVQKCSCFLHWNSFLFPSIAQWWCLHCSLLLLLWWWWWCCCASSPVVHAPHFTSADFHFFNQTNTDAAWWQRVDFPEWLCYCVIVWSSFVLKECNAETSGIFQGDILGWYQLNTNWRRRRRRRRVLSYLRNIPSVVGNSKLNRADAVSHYKIIYFHQTSFQSEKWKFALLRFGTINRK